MFTSGGDNGNPFGIDGPFSGGGSGPLPPSGGMFGDMDGGTEEELFGLEPVEFVETGDVHAAVDVGLHFHGAMREMRK